MADSERDPEVSEELFEEYTRAPSRRLRNRIVEAHMGLAVHIVRRYSSGGDEEDLEQVALLALVRAVERFDPTRGFSFATFAGRTIEGELKHHFRDRTWGVRVPRSLKDLRVAVRSASDELTASLGRTPRIGEVAAHLGVPADDVVEALGADSARTPQSLDAPSPHEDGDDGGPSPLPDPSAETGFGFVEDRDQLDDLLVGLQPRERRIVHMRFVQQLTQQQIADEIGVSQMQVSRLLRRALETLRARSGDD